VAPDKVAAMWDAAANGDYARARTLHEQTQRITDALFSEPSPIPVKAALAMMGKIAPEIRLPLVAMAGPARERLRAVLSEHGLV
jgi:4-hydroxy-tetrahydrodipicolinate synthase